MKIKQHILLAPLLICCFFLTFGCESGQNDYVTSDLFNREPGVLKRIALEPDSLTLSGSYHEDIELNSTMLAGQYGAAEAFSVVKFLRPPQSEVDSLVQATLHLTISSTWSLGAAEFDLHLVTSDWTDEEPLDPELFLPMGEPVATLVDEADSLSELTFSVPVENIRSWENYGSYLISATEAGQTMLSLMTEHSNSSPYFEFVSKTSVGGLDTTTVWGYQDSYYFETGFDPENKAMSDGNAAGYKLDIALPSSLPQPAAINKVILTLELGDHLIARPNGMPITIKRLTEAFNPDSTIVSDLSSALSVTIDPEVQTYTLDITAFVFEWVNLDSPNYGLVFQPVQESASPDYAVIAPVDSMIIHYTTLPELE